MSKIVYWILVLLFFCISNSSCIYFRSNWFFETILRTKFLLHGQFYWSFVCFWLLPFIPYLTPSAFQYWTSIYAIPHHCWIVERFMSFLTCQTCVQSDFTMVGLVPSAKAKFCTVIEPTLSCATVFAVLLSFTPLKFAWKKQISREKTSIIYYMGDLHLQLPSTDLQLEFGKGLCFWTKNKLSCWGWAFRKLVVFLI